MAALENRHLLPPSLALSLLLACRPCNQGTPCEHPGAKQACVCTDHESGTRICLPERVFDDCNCKGPAASKSDGGAGASAQPAADASTATSTSMVDAGNPVRAGGSAGVGDSGAAGQGGHAAVADAGGAAGSTGGAGGRGGQGGEGGAGGGGSGGGAGAAMTAVYTSCTGPSDCGHLASECTTVAADPVLGTPAGSVCAPPCTAPADCPVPDGSFEATLICDNSFCRLECTPDVPLGTERTCPSGMHCVMNELTRSFCFR